MNHDELIEKAGIKLCDIGIKLIHEPAPLAQSRSGSNTVYHACDILQARPSYASCLHVMDHQAEGVHVDLRPECHAAIACRTCPAQKMRMAELKAGHALFFVDYQALTREREARAKAADDGILFGRRGRDPAAKTKKFVPTVFDAKGQPIFDNKVLAELEENPVVIKPKTQKLERVGKKDPNNIMQKVLEKVIDNESN